MTSTEARYARIVRLYPARAPRAEILDTVLESGGRFSYREAFSLIVGGLRARAGTDVHRSPADFTRTATRFAALTLLVYATAVDVLSALPLDWQAVFRAPDGIIQYATAGLVALLLHGTAIVTLCRGAYRFAAGAALLGLAASLAGQARFGVSPAFEGLWAAPLALLLTAALLIRPRPERSSPIGWLIAVPPAIVILPTGAAGVLGPAWFIQQQAFTVLIVLALIWSFVDSRVPLAVAALGLCRILTAITVVTTGGYVGSEDAVALSFAITALPHLALVAAAAFGRRRSAI